MNLLSGSISRMQAEQECPRGALGRALKLPPPGPDPDYLLVGTVHHERTALRISDESGRWPNAAEIDGWHPGLDEDLAYLESRTEEIISHQLPGATDIEVERGFAFREDWTECEWEAEDVYWRQRSDLTYRVDGRLHVEDWKTGRKILKGVPPHMRFQILSYCIPYAIAGEEEMTSQVAQVRGGLWGVREERVRANDVAETMEAIEGWMRKWRSLPEDDPLAWKARPCRMCASCPFARDCPELLGQLEGGLQVPETAEQVVELALAMEAHEKLAKTLSGLLSEATERLGPVDLPTGKTIGHLPREERSVADPFGYMAALEARGADPEVMVCAAVDGMTVTKARALAGLVKWKRGEKTKTVTALLEEFGRVETVTTFTQKSTEEIA